MLKTYRVGLIGNTGRGDYGHQVDMAFTRVPQVEIVAVADPDPQGRAAAVSRTAAQRSYADYREMLSRERLDIVGICPRWIDEHHAMLLAAADAGCHVYMEKPFCRDLLECDEVVNQFDMRHLKLGIAHISQYSPALDQIGKLIAADEIGQVLEIRGRGKEDRRGGGEDLWVLGSHIFGIMRSVAGGNPLAVTAQVTCEGRPLAAADARPGAEGIGPLAGDHVEACYEFPQGIRGYFASRRGMAGNPTRFAVQIFGSKGIIETESGYLAPAAILRDSSWSPARTGKHWEPISSAGIGVAEPRSDGNYQGGHVAAITDLIAAIEQQRPTRCGYEDARAIIEMIAAVFESQRLGQRVRLPLQTRANPLTLLDAS